LSALADLKAVTTLKGVAALLGYKASSLAYVLYKIPPAKKYSTFDIPKKSGGVRKITAPDKQLKALQRSLARLLVECRREIESKNLKGTKSLSHGFKENHSTLTNSLPHVRHRYVFNFDLRDFFPSINFGRVRGLFLKDKNFALNEKCATILAQIACYDGALPQGSPSSPIISDLVTRILDIRLARLAKKHGCTYSRYADDLTFSTNLKQFPKAIAKATKPSGSWEIGKELASEIKNADFKINSKKTRMQYCTNRQTVTGLTVNSKVNIPSGYYQIARAMCNARFMKGAYQFKHLPAVTDTARLRGQLSYIFHVKFSDLDRRKQTVTQPVDSKPKKLVGWQKLYGRFLFHETFVTLDRPLILCEGVTDSVYLKAALRAMGAKFPNLATVTAGKQTRKISFFKYGKHSDLLFHLGGGSDKLRTFINNYETNVSYFGYAPLKYPVVILIDNDKGADGIFGLMKSKFKTEISKTTKLPFYPIARNLILIKTPEIGSEGTSQIESFFDQEVLDEKVSGKTFNSAKTIDVSKEYGKVVFAEKVVIPNKNKISFSKFEPLLDRINSAVGSYKPTGVSS
jgi:retron-type reverse transcriptase